MTFEPYSPSVDLAQAPRVRQPAREAVLYRMFWSLGCAALSCVSIVAMVCLVEWHDPGQSMITGDAFPFNEVVIPLGIAGIAASLAFLFSVPVFLSGRIMPATWLLPLVLFILWFFTFYDWAGLFNSGKPQVDLLEYGMRMTTGMLSESHCRYMLCNFVLIVIACIWVRWDTCRTAVRDAVAFEQIAANEIASQSAPKH